MDRLWDLLEPGDQARSRLGDTDATPRNSWTPHQIALFERCWKELPISHSISPVGRGVCWLRANENAWMQETKAAARYSNVQSWHHALPLWMVTVMTPKQLPNSQAISWPSDFATLGDEWIFMVRCLSLFAPEPNSAPKIPGSKQRDKAFSVDRLPSLRQVPRHPSLASQETTILSPPIPQALGFQCLRKPSFQLKVAKRSLGREKTRTCVVSHHLVVVWLKAPKITT